MNGSASVDLVLLEAIADPVRLAIVRRLSAAGPARASELLVDLDVGQPTVSHHLKVLRTAGWIEGERRGRTILYRLRTPAVGRLQAIVDGLRPRREGPQRAGPPPGETGEAASPRVTVPRTDWRQW